MKDRREKKGRYHMSMMNLFGIPWRLFDELCDLPYDEILRGTSRGQTPQYPRVNIWENDTGLVLEAEIAGVDPAKLDISAEGNVLTIKGEKTQLNERVVTFQRSFTIPFALAESEIKATVKNGLLTLSIPRKVATKRKIEISAE